MNTVCAGDDRDVEPVVHQHARCGASCDVNTVGDHLREEPPFEIALPDLDQMNALSGGRRDTLDQTRAPGCAQPSAIGDETEDRAQAERSRLR